VLGDKYNYWSAYRKALAVTATQPAKERIGKEEKKPPSSLPFSDTNIEKKDP